MLVFKTCKLVANSKESFKNKDTGEEVTYFINVLKTDDGGIINANSKADFGDCEGDWGVAGLEMTVKVDTNGFGSPKYNLKSFLSGAEIPVADVKDMDD